MTKLHTAESKNVNVLGEEDLAKVVGGWGNYGYHHHNGGGGGGMRFQGGGGGGTRRRGNGSGSMQQRGNGGFGGGGFGGRGFGGGNIILINNGTIEGDVVVGSIVE